MLRSPVTPSHSREAADIRPTGSPQPGSTPPCARSATPAGGEADREGPGRSLCPGPFFPSRAPPAGGLFQIRPPAHHGDSRDPAIEPGEPVGSPWPRHRGLSSQPRAPGRAGGHGHQTANAVPAMAIIQKTAADPLPVTRPVRVAAGTSATGSPAPGTTPPYAWPGRQLPTLLRNPAALPARLTSTERGTSHEVESRLRPVPRLRRQVSQRAES